MSANGVGRLVKGCVVGGAGLFDEGDEAVEVLVWHCCSLGWKIGFGSAVSLASHGRARVSNDRNRERIWYRSPRMVDIVNSNGPSACG